MTAISLYTLFSSRSERPPIVTYECLIPRRRVLIDVLMPQDRQVEAAIALPLLLEFVPKPAFSDNADVAVWIDARPLDRIGLLPTTMEVVETMRVSVILPAAGLGTRMGKSSKKQFLQLDGAPILIHTLRRFAKVASVNEIIIACRAEDMDDVRGMLAGAHVDKPVRLVEGGASRQESVEHALATVGAGVDLVAVHDAVRPFADVAMIEKVIAEAAECGAAIVAIVPVDTVKQVHLNKIQTTISRDRLVLAQTPQVFKTSLLRRAFAKAKEDGFAGTDESSLVERLDAVEVHVVPGSDRNIKITKPSDLDLAKHFLSEEHEA